MKLSGPRGQMESGGIHEYYIITHRKKYQLKEQMLFYRSNRLDVVIVGKV